MYCILYQRNRCSCYIQLKEYKKATDAIQQAKKHDYNSPQTQFLIFKLALLLNREEEGERKKPTYDGVHGIVLDFYSC